MYLGYNPTNTAITASFLSSAGWANSPHTITLPKDEWVNIQVTWDGTNFIIYENGNMHGTIYRPGFASVNNGNGYRFGRKWDNSSGVCIQGEMGEIRIYNISLTSSQVKSVYNESAADFSRPALPPGTENMSTHSLSTELSFVVNHNDTFGIQMWGPTTTTSSWGGSMLLEKAAMVQGGGRNVAVPAIPKLRKRSSIKIRRSSEPVTSKAKPTTKKAERPMKQTTYVTPPEQKPELRKRTSAKQPKANNNATTKKSSKK
jgi:hypothetical protein